MTDLRPPSRAARAVVGLLTSLGLLTGGLVLGLVAFFALYVGAPPWVVAAGVVAALGCLVVALQRVRRSAARP